MKHSKKITLLAALTALFGVAGASTIGATAEVVNPGAPESFAIVESVAVRTSSPYGIRFTANISAEDHNALTAYAEAQGTTLEYGVLVIPEDLLGGETLDANDAEGNLRESTKEGTEADTVAGYTNNYQKIVVEPSENADGSFAITGGIKGILANNVSRKFQARAYVLVDGVYYYTEAFSRSIYTAATYAIDGLEEGSAARKYFQEDVIDRVEEVYTQASLEITSDALDAAYDMARVGDYIHVKGFVTNPNNGKALESKATLAKEDNLSHVSGATYQASAMGNVETTASVAGQSDIAGKTIAVKENYAVIDENVTTTYKWTKKWGGANDANAYLSYVEEHQGMKNVVRYANSATESAAAASARFLPLAEKNVCISAGKFYVMDVCLAGMFQFESYNGKDSNGPASYRFWAAQYFTDPAWNTTGKEWTGAFVFEDSAGNPFMTLTAYDLMGNPLTGYLSEYANTWITLQLELHQDCYGLAYYRYHTNDTYHNYFANIRIQDYSLGAPTELVTLAPATEVKDVYEAGETVAFNLEYKDSLGRIRKGDASIATVTGNAIVGSEGITLGLLGNATVSATVGETTKSYTLVGPTQFTVNQANITNGHYVDTVGGTSTSSQSIELLDSFMGIENVAHIYGKGGDTWAVGFSEAEETATATARYMYVQMLVSQNYNLYTNVFDKVTTITANVANKIQFYNAKGEQSTKVSVNPTQTVFQNYDTVGKWFTLEYINFTLGGLNKAFLSGLNSYATGTRHIFIKSIVFSTERLAEEHVTANEDGTETKTYTVDAIQSTELIAEHNGTLEMLTTPGLYLDSRVQSYNSIVPATLGEESVYEWKYTRTTKDEDGNPVYEIAKDLRFTALTVNSANYKGNTKYLYMDIYVQDTSGLAFNLASTFGWDNAAHIANLYGTVSNTYCVVTCYDKDGKQLADNNLNNYKNQWVTVQFRFNGNTTAQGANGFYIGNSSELLAAYVANPTNLECVPRVYFKSIALTTIPRTFA